MNSTYLLEYLDCSHCGVVEMARFLGFPFCPECGLAGEEE